MKTLIRKNDKLKTKMKKLEYANMTDENLALEKNIKDLNGTLAKFIQGKEKLNTWMGMIKEDLDMIPLRNKTFLKNFFLKSINQNNLCINCNFYWKNWCILHSYSINKNRHNGLKRFRFHKTFTNFKIFGYQNLQGEYIFL